MRHRSCKCVTLNNSMDKKRIEIEHTLNSTSRNIVWQLIGTAEGLNRWIADDVKMNGKHIEFAWGDDWRHHETRQATLTFNERYERVRWQWDDEDDESFVEIRMERSTLSGQYTLHITDFVSNDDLEWLQDTWSYNFERLRRTSGV